ncbi:MAG TPA: hypothetical protein VHE35_09020 [Kofleriaceae bacterium]|nr:hypothetical protein [Kofleriaceae bacterium]
MIRTVRSFATTILLAAVASLGSACVDDESTSPAVIAEPIIDSPACACTSDACREQYVEDNLGCDVCVTFDCGGQRTGVCASCAERPEHASTPGNAPPPSELGGYRYTRSSIPRAAGDPATVPGRADTVQVVHHRPPHATLPGVHLPF